jgi:hypothetical protein
MTAQMRKDRRIDGALPEIDRFFDILGCMKMSSALSVASSHAALASPR